MALIETIRFNTLTEVKAAIDAGKVVSWTNGAYHAIKSADGYAIKFDANGNLGPLEADASKYFIHVLDQI